MVFFFHFKFKQTTEQKHAGENIFANSESHTQIKVKKGCRSGDSHNEKPKLKSLCKFGCNITIS